MGKNRYDPLKQLDQYNSLIQSIENKILMMNRKKDKGKKVRSNSLVLSPRRQSSVLIENSRQSENRPVEPASSAQYKTSDLSPYKIFLSIRPFLKEYLSTLIEEIKFSLVKDLKEVIKESVEFHLIGKKVHLDLKEKRKESDLIRKVPVPLQEITKMENKLKEIPRSEMLSLLSAKKINREVSQIRKENKELNNSLDQLSKKLDKNFQNLSINIAESKNPQTAIIKDVIAACKRTKPVSSKQVSRSLNRGNKIKNSSFRNVKGKFGVTKKKGKKIKRNNKLNTITN